MFHGRQYRFEEILEALWRRRWLVIIPLWIVIVATITVTASLADRYESEVRIRLIPSRVSEAYVRSAVRSRLDERLPAISAHVLDVQRLQQIATEFDLYRHTAAGPDDVVSLMRQDVRVQIQPPDTIRVSYTSPNAQTAMAVAERLGALFVNENRRQSDRAAAQTTDFLDAQLDSARRNLETHDQQLEEYRRQHSGELPSQLESNLEMLRSAQMQRQTIRESIDRDRNEMLMLDRLIADSETTPAASPAARSSEARSDDPARSDGSVLQQLQAANGELAALENRLKPAHPDVVRLKRRIADLESQLAAESRQGATISASSQTTSSPLLRRDPRTAQLSLQREKLDRQVSSKQAEEAGLKAQINSYQRRIDGTPARETELTALTRDYDTLKEVYTKLLARKEEAKISASLQEDEIGEQFVIIEPAKLPTQPSSPNRLQRNIVGGLFGLLLGIGLAAFAEYRDTSARTERDILSGFGLPVLAAIPVMTTTAEIRWNRIRQVAWSLIGLSGAAATTMWLRHFVG